MLPLYVSIAEGTNIVKSTCTYVRMYVCTYIGTDRSLFLGKVNIRPYISRYLQYIHTYS